MEFVLLNLSFSVWCFINHCLALRPFSFGYCAVCPFPFGYCIVCPFSFGYCIICLFSSGYCIICPFSFGYCIICPFSFGYSIICPFFLLLYCLSRFFWLLYYLSLFFWLLYYLSLFFLLFYCLSLSDLQILITVCLSSTFSYRFILARRGRWCRWKRLALGSIRSSVQFYWLGPQTTGRCRKIWRLFNALCRRTLEVVWLIV